MNKQEIIASDGQEFPAASFTQAVLRPAYDEAKRAWLAPMVDIHRAHLIMLHERGLLGDETVRKMAGAIQRLDLDALATSEYDGSHEDLFFTVEDALLQLGGEEMGSLHMARSRNDMGMALNRMVMRPRLLGVLGAALELHETLTGLAAEHSATLTLEHTHTQPAQPSILGHRFVAIADVLERDMGRLRGAYHALNLSPLGAAALGGTGFPIDRDLVAKLLAFDGIVENTYDAVAGTDYLAQAAQAIELLAVDTGRSCVDFLVWATAEFGLYRATAPYVQVSSIMPQKRNPVSIEHSRALLSSAAVSARGVMSMMHNTPFGDIVDTEDDMQPHMRRATEITTAALRLLARVLGTIEINTALMRQRAIGSFANATELADSLVRDGGYTFREAHMIVAAVVRRAVSAGLTDVRQLTAADVAVAGRDLGREVDLDDEWVASALDADHFVGVRRSVGGVAPEEVRRMAGDRLGHGRRWRSWIQSERLRLADAHESLACRVADLAA